MSHRVCVIGLGVMGQRMLTNMAEHEHFTVTRAWDPDAGACQATRDAFPAVQIAGNAGDAMGAADVDVVYIACPPFWHREHARAAFDAGKPVYCEKPLGVDVVESRELCAAAAECGLANIVNFSLASAAATQEVERRLAEGVLGEISGVDVRLHFSQWPREWQMDAASWLSLRAQGGFAREVLSHWIYLTERLFGAATLEDASVRYPGGDVAETHLTARLRVDELPVTVAGSVGGVGPDRVEYTVWGARQSCRIHDWNRLFSATSGSDWKAELTHLDDPRQVGYMLQLDNAAAAFQGDAHSMPSFADALRVQILIEDILGH
jgi:predicted dehydrogenase